jgi:hypothetical protein
MACQPGLVELGPGSRIRRRERWIRAWEAGSASSVAAGSRRQGEERQAVPVVEVVDPDSGRRHPPCRSPEIAKDGEEESQATGVFLHEELAFRSRVKSLATTILGSRAGFPAAPSGGEGRGGRGVGVAVAARVSARAALVGG